MSESNTLPAQPVNPTATANPSPPAAPPATPPTTAPAAAPTTAPAAPAAPAAPSAPPANPPAAAGPTKEDQGKPAPPAAAPKPGDPPAPERPAWLPEKFKTAEDLAKSYGELEGAFGRKAEAFKAELQAEARKGVPEKPADYKLELADDLLPAGFKAVVDEHDPFLSEMRELMHTLGAKPEQFNAAASAFLRWQVGNMPDVAAEKLKLGEGADARTQAVDSWLSKNLTEPEYRAMMAGIVTATGIEAVEKLMRLATAQGLTTTPSGGGTESLTPEQAQAILRDPNYRNDGPEGVALRSKFQAFVAAGGRLPGYGSGGFSR